MDELTKTLEHAEFWSELAIATPVCISHSKDDDTVPFENGLRLCQGLERLGMGVTWKGYEEGADLPHWIHEQHGVNDMAEFIKEQLQN